MGNLYVVDDLGIHNQSRYVSSQDGHWNKHHTYPKLHVQTSLLYKWFYIDNNERIEYFKIGYVKLDYNDHIKPIPDGWISAATESTGLSSFV